MKRLLRAFRAPRKIILGILVFLGAHACRDGQQAKITFTAPSPEPVPIFWIDSAGNLGLRGAVAVVPGFPAPDAKLTAPCRKSATENGPGTLTVCMEQIVGRTIAEKTGLDWTSGTSGKR